MSKGLMFATFSVLVSIFIMTFYSFRFGLSKFRQKTVAKKLLLVAAGGILVEFFAFNFHAISTRNLQEIPLNLEDNISKDTREIIIEGLDVPSKTIKVDTSGGLEIANVKVNLSDEAYAKNFAFAGTIKVCPGGRHHSDVLLIPSNGNLKRIQLKWDKPSTAITYVGINAPMPFHFHWIRYLCLILPIMLLLILGEKEIRGVVWNPSSVRQKMAFFLTVVSMLLMAFWVVVLILPQDGQAVDFSTSYFGEASLFSMLVIIFGSLCFWEMAKTYVCVSHDRQIPAVVFFLVAPAVVLGSNILMLESVAVKPFRSILSGMVFFYLSLWSMMEVRLHKNRCVQAAFCIFSAMAAVLLLCSSPAGAASLAGWIIPLCVFLLVSDEYNNQQKTVCAVSFCIPLLVGTCTILCLNYIRFGSPFSLGDFWQWTTEDIHSGEIQLSDLPEALYYYFFDSLSLRSEFPFIRCEQHYINHTGSSFHCEAGAGIFSMPITWTFFLCIKKGWFEKKERIVFLSAIFCTVIASWVGFGIFGVAQRYISNILPTMCLLGAMVFLKLSDMAKDRPFYNLYTDVVCAVSMMTIFVALCLVFGSFLNTATIGDPARYKNTAAYIAPDNYLSIFRMFKFY